jgi:hypothetical protein
VDTGPPWHEQYGDLKADLLREFTLKARYAPTRRVPQVGDYVLVRRPATRKESEDVRVAEDFIVRRTWWEVESPTDPTKPDRAKAKAIGKTVGIFSGVRVRSLAAFE